MASPTDEGDALLSRVNLAVKRGLTRLRTERLFSDFVVHVQDESFPCHKVMLASVSDYFEAMFTSGMKEASLNETVLENVRPECFALILDTIYSPDTKDELFLDLQDYQILELLRISDMLQIACLSDVIFSHFKRTMSASNCVERMQAGNETGAKELYKMAYKCIMQNFDTVAVTNKLSTCSFEDLLSIIRNDNIQVSREENVWYAISRWIKFDKEHRQDYIEQLIQHCCLTEVNFQCLSEMIAFDPAVRRNDEVTTRVREAVRYRYHPEEHGSLELHYRNNMGKMQVDVMLGESHDCILMTMFSAENGTWIKDKSVDGPTSGYACCVYSNSIIVSGGNEPFARNVYEFSGTDMSWHKRKRKLPIPLEQHTMVAGDGDLYVISGLSFSDLSWAIMQFNIKTDTWNRHGEVVIPVTKASAVCHSEKIYIVGGLTEQDEPVQVIQEYDINTNTTTIICDLPAPCSFSHSLIRRDTLYTVTANGEVLRFELPDRKLCLVAKIPELARNVQTFGIAVRNKTLKIFCGDVAFVKDEDTTSTVDFERIDSLSDESQTEAEDIATAEGNGSPTKLLGNDLTQKTGYINVADSDAESETAEHYDGQQMVKDRNSDSVNENENLLTADDHCMSSLSDIYSPTVNEGTENAAPIMNSIYVLRINEDTATTYEAENVDKDQTECAESLPLKEQEEVKENTNTYQSDMKVLKQFVEENVMSTPPEAGVGSNSENAIKTVLTEEENATLPKETLPGMLTNREFVPFEENEINSSSVTDLTQVPENNSDTKKMDFIATSVKDRCTCILVKDRNVDCSVAKQEVAVTTDGIGNQIEEHINEVQTEMYGSASTSNSVKREEKRISSESINAFSCAASKAESHEMETSADGIFDQMTGHSNAVLLERCDIVSIDKHKYILSSEADNNDQIIAITDAVPNERGDDVSQKGDDEKDAKFSIVTGGNNGKMDINPNPIRGESSEGINTMNLLSNVEDNDSNNPDNKTADKTMVNATADKQTIACGECTSLAADVDKTSQVIDVDDLPLKNKDNKGYFSERTNAMNLHSNVDDINNNNPETADQRIVNITDDKQTIEYGKSASLVANTDKTCQMLVADDLPLTTEDKKSQSNHINHTEASAQHKEDNTDIADIGFENANTKLKIEDETCPENNNEPVEYGSGNESDAELITTGFLRPWAILSFSHSSLTEDETTSSLIENDDEIYEDISEVYVPSDFDENPVAPARAELLTETGQAKNINVDLTTGKVEITEARQNPYYIYNCATVVVINTSNASNVAPCLPPRNYIP